MKHLLFDLDNTLFDFNQAEIIAFKETMDSVGLVYDQAHYELYDRINSALWSALERNEIQKDELKIKRFVDYLAESQQKMDADQLKDVYEKTLAKQGILFEGAYELIEKLSKRIKMSAATNGITSIQLGRLADAQLNPFFEHVFISEAMHCQKPDPVFFEKVLTALNLNKEEVLMIGDSLSADIKGCVLSNIPCVWYNPHRLENHSEFKPTYEIHHFDELYAIVEGI